MAVDTQHPGDLARYLLFQFKQRAGERVELGATLGLVEGGLAGIEKYFRLEYEAVPDDADIRPVAEDRAQPSEEVGPVSRQLLHPLGERHVEALAEVSDARLRILVLLLGRVERLLERRKLAPQGGDLLVEHLDLRQRARGEPFLRIELTAERVGLALRVGGAAADAFIETFVAVALAFGAGQARSQRGQLFLEDHLAGLLQRKKLRELRDLDREAAERGVFAGHFLGQVELHDDEYRQQKDDAEHQRRQRVDETRPIIHAAVAARACESHRVLLQAWRALLVHVFAHQNFEQTANVPMLLGLRIDPVADHLLLGAHVVDQPLYRFGEIGHGSGRRPVRPAVGDRLPQTLDGHSQVARERAWQRARRRLVAADAEIAHGGREPVLQLGIEAVLRLAGLQVEESQHERAGQSEQRR